MPHLEVFAARKVTVDTTVDHVASVIGVRATTVPPKINIHASSAFEGEADHSRLHITDVEYGVS
jgi:hypothetical protein